MSENISRRRFLCRLTVLSAAVLLPTAAEAASPSAWVRVGPAEKFTVGHFTQVSLKDDSVVFITRTAPDTFLALAGSCTHKGCPIEWDAKAHQFACPCHKGRFDDTGRNVGGPPPRPLPQYKTRIESDGVLSVFPPS